MDLRNSRGCLTLKVCLTISLLVRNAEGAVFDPATETDIRDFVEATIKCRYIPGMTLSIVKGNDTWTAGFGHANMDTGASVDNGTLFGIGSVSKSFTMTLMGILLTEKKMNWTARVTEILGPGYGFIDEYRTTQTTLKDLLSHRTGLSRLDIGLFGGIPASIDRAQYCKKMKYAPEEHPFRDQFLYNNYMYMLVGHVAEKLGGDTWENLVTSRIFEPLGMTSTRIMRQPDDVMGPHVARPYIYRDGAFHNGTTKIYNLHPVEPAGAILSSSADMARYMRFVLNDGKTETGEQLLDEKLFKQAFTSVTTLADPNLLRTRTLLRPNFPVPETQIGYGYAWFTSTYNGYLRHWHSGGVFSYITLLWLFPQQNIAIFGSVNGPGFQNYSITALSSSLYHISDTLLDNIPWINSSNTCTIGQMWKAPEVPIKPVEISVHLTNPQEYIGVFGNAYLPSIDIRLNPDSTYSLLFEMGRLGGVLYSTQDTDRFLMVVTSPWEYQQSFLDSNNQTTRINSTFHRQNGKVDTLEISFEVSIIYKKDFSIFDDEKTTSSACQLLATNYINISIQTLILFISNHLMQRMIGAEAV